jgi:hypothetical protein
MNCRDIKPHLLMLTAAEQAELGKNPITKELELEAALCAWEHLLEVYRNNPDGFDYLGGAGQARMICAELAPAIHYGYHIANVDDKCHAFDWDFVPWFMENCVVWDDKMIYVHRRPDLVPNWVELCREHGNPSAPPDEYEFTLTMTVPRDELETINAAHAIASLAEILQRDLYDEAGMAGSFQVTNVEGPFNADRRKQTEG